jgi:hypothetical protein
VLSIQDGDDIEWKKEQEEKRDSSSGDNAQSMEKEDYSSSTEDEEAQLLKDWNDTATFQGYMAWAVWGHIPMPGMDDYYKSQQFSASTEIGEGNVDKKRKGRVASRDNKAVGI